MGIAASWISVSGLSKAELLDRLGAVDTGQIVWLPGKGEMAFAELPSGRLVVVSDDFTFASTRHQEISLGADVTGARVDDHTGYASSWQCSKGRLLWSMERHDQEPEVLRIEGAPPARYVAAWKRAVEDDDDEARLDAASDLPVAAAVDLGGFDINDWTGSMSVLGAVDDFMIAAGAEETREHKAYIAAWEERKRAENPGLVAFLRRILMLD